ASAKQDAGKPVGNTPFDYVTAKEEPLTAAGKTSSFSSDGLQPQAPSVSAEHIAHKDERQAPANADAHRISFDCQTDFSDDGPDGEYSAKTQTAEFRKKLRRKLTVKRLGFLAEACVTLAILFWENADLDRFFPEVFTRGAVPGLVDAALMLLAVLIGVVPFASGIKALFQGRCNPKTAVAAESLLCITYTVYAVLAKENLHYVNFVPALGFLLVFLFDSMEQEGKLQSFGVISSPGDKLTFSMMTPIHAKREADALGFDLSHGEFPKIYRIRKAGFVYGFRKRTEESREDYVLNAWISGLTVLVGGGCFALNFFLLKGELWTSLETGLFGLLLTTPLCMCASHIYPVFRTIDALGDTATVLGEQTVRECETLHGVAFEDIEAIPSKNIKVTQIIVYSGDLSDVLCYASGMFHAVGGPLRDYFGRSTKEMGTPGDVQLLESVKG
ncbi:MAG: hypothetical protein MJ078_07305, partial [Clostridia bacterium]|nr:hypothetical protein [Clostridia bacterium]